MRMQKYFSFLFLPLLLPVSVSAAALSLHAAPAAIGAGDTVQITVLLDSSIAVNAFSGTLIYSSSLEPIAVSDGNSIVNMWITRPAITGAGAPIAFAGITPGGFSGDNGVLFSVLFRAATADTAKLSLGNIAVLRNDGAGGNEPTAAQPLTLSISATPSGGYAEPADIAPPEPFTAYLGTDPQLFGGKSYLVFMAVDKGSGIDQYAVAESRLPSFLLPFFPLVWENATSPYLLADQNLTSTVYLKAIDRAGNERLSVYPPLHSFIYERIILLGILTLVVLLWWGRWGRRS